MSKNGFNPSYIGQRADVRKMVPYGVGAVLDVGCSDGSLGAGIRQSRKNSSVFGIEMSAKMGATAQERLDKVFIGDASKIIFDGSLDKYRFDVIIFADILEHLVEPWAVLQRAKRYLKPGGCIILSLPNVRHINTIYNLLVKGRWPYRARGIHDRTHLRFFTLKNIQEMVNDAGFELDELETNYRLVEGGHKFNKYSHLFALPGLKGLLAFQYLLKIKVRQA